MGLEELTQYRAWTAATTVGNYATYGNDSLGEVAGIQR